MNGIVWTYELPSVPVQLGTAREQPPGAAPTVTAEERFRSTMTFGGRDVERFALVRLYEGGRSSVDRELFAFVGDRVFLFTSAPLAKDVLESLPAEKDALGNNPMFAAAAASWRDGAALQGYLPFPSGGAYTPAVVEVTADQEGVALRVRSAASGHSWYTRAASMLPAGAISWGPVRLPEPSVGQPILGTTLPDWLFGTEITGLLAWYPSAPGPLPGRWLWLLNDGKADKDVATWLEKARLARLSERITAIRGVWGVRRGGFIILGSDRELLEALSTNPDNHVVSRFDGDAARPAITQALRRAGTGATADQLRWLAHMVGLARRAELTEEAQPDGTSTGTIRVDLHVADEGTDVMLVDSWLGEETLRNALPLPRTLGPREAAAPLTWTIEVEDANAIAESTHWNVSGRMRLEVVDAHRLRVHVIPGPTSTAEPLTDEVRKRFLSSDADAGAPEIVKKARELVPAGTGAADAAQRILTFVHGHLTYEITRESMSAQAVLKRRRGDCTEFSQLVVALLRAAGVPAQLREGLLASDDELVAHVWVAYHDGVGWREIEPTSGEPRVGSGHLELPILDVLAAITAGELRVVDVVQTP